MFCTVQTSKLIFVYQLKPFFRLETSPIRLPVRNTGVISLHVANNVVIKTSPNLTHRV